jgi:hypothetical protein
MMHLSKIYLRLLLNLRKVSLVAHLRLARGLNFFLLWAQNAETDIPDLFACAVKAPFLSFPIQFFAILFISRIYVFCFV